MRNSSNCQGRSARELRAMRATAVRERRDGDQASLAIYIEGDLSKVTVGITQQPQVGRFQRKTINPVIIDPTTISKGTALPQRVHRENRTRGQEREA